MAIFPSYFDTVEEFEEFCYRFYCWRGTQGFTTSSWEKLEEKNREQYREAIKYAFGNREKPLKPIPLILFCFHCGERHIDKGVFATKPHHTHACQSCGVVWRPAIECTVGVEFLPGFKDKE